MSSALMKINKGRGFLLGAPCITGYAARILGNRCPAKDILNSMKVTYQSRAIARLSRLKGIYNVFMHQGVLKSLVQILMNLMQASISRFIRIQVAGGGFIKGIVALFLRSCQSVAVQVTLVAPLVLIRDVIASWCDKDTAQYLYFVVM